MEATVSLGVFDMSNKQREHYNKNKNTLKIYLSNKYALYFWNT